MKTVFVCYYDYDYSGCSEPIRVFLTEQEVMNWLDEEADSYAKYVEIEIG